MLCWSSREEIPHIQGKRNPSKMVGVARGHQRADTMKPYSQKTSQSNHTRTTSLSNSLKPSHARGATEDGWVMVERTDRMWSTGEGNGKPLQYSCLENPMNCTKRQNDRILKEELSNMLLEISGEITPAEGHPRGAASQYYHLLGIGHQYTIFIKSSKKTRMQRSDHAN